MVGIQLASKEQAFRWVRSLKPSPAVGALLPGDRWSCMDEVFLAEMEDKIVGIATMASNGEGMSGEPTIVALYVLLEYRRRNIGFQLLDAAVDYMVSKGLEPIRIDAISSKIIPMISRLSIEKRRKINVVDQSMGGATDFWLEA